MWDILEAILGNVLGLIGGVSLGKAISIGLGGPV
jgi:hypothetical protein